MMASTTASTTAAPPSPVLLSVEHVSKRFVLRRTVRDRVAKRPGLRTAAVDDVSFRLAKGEILGLAGGSGSGKTTLVRMLIRLVEPDEGRILFDGTDVRRVRGRALREVRRNVQMVFQDPYSSLNPRMSVGAAILEAGRVHGQPGSEDGQAFVSHHLELVHLSTRVAGSRPRELSGGQRQRVAIARALAAGPKVLLADEAVSALDVSIQTQLLNLFLDLRDELGLSIIFVAHQLSVIAEVADRVAIMHLGKIVESGETGEVFAHPQDLYTKTLLAAHPRPALAARQVP
jgi:ABC-type glutathione transport system ATPase component